LRAVAPAVRVTHVNLPVPHGASGAVAGFYVRVFGFTVADRPDTGRAGAWLDVGDGTQVHLSEHDGSAHPDQHVAFVVDDLGGIATRAASEAAEWTERGPGRAVLRDPAGNLVEVFAPEALPA
jgi:catechol 2,3-dioxygenase-like lactoylglutathione lyase family enzyme